MRMLLGATAALVLLAACERRAHDETTRSGVETVITSSTVKDTTVVRSDTSVDVDTVRRASGTITVTRDSAGRAALTWGRQPPGLPAGARVAVVWGNPTKPGPFTIQADLPDGYEIKPHWHPAVERVEVLEGTFLKAEGRDWRGASLKAYGPGQVVTVAAKHPHFVRAKGNTLIEIQSTGPFEITYVNPADDPRRSPIP
jgi:hypothetical protein